jgi:hypothetical protein
MGVELWSPALAVVRRLSFQFNTAVAKDEHTRLFLCPQAPDRLIVTRAGFVGIMDVGIMEPAQQPPEEGAGAGAGAGAASRDLPLALGAPDPSWLPPGVALNRPRAAMSAVGSDKPGSLCDLDLFMLLPGGEQVWQDRRTQHLLVTSAKRAEGAGEGEAADRWAVACPPQWKVQKAAGWTQGGFVATITGRETILEKRNTVQLWARDAGGPRVVTDRCWRQVPGFGW